MRRRDKILVHFLSIPQKDVHSLEDALVELSQEHIEIIHMESIEELPVGSQLLFVYTDKNAKELEQIIHRKNQINGAVKVVLILGEKDYSTLKVAFRMGVIEVIELPIQQAALTRALGKNQLLQYQLTHKQSPDLPIDNLLQLFAAPIKLKQDENVFSYLRDYVMQFSEVQDFGVFFYPEKYLPLYGSIPLEEDILEKIISTFPMKENFVGTYNVFCEESVCFIIFPLYETEKNGVLWGGLVMQEDISTKIMNEYFLNFLQSVFYFRRAKESAENFQELANKDEVTGLYNQRKLTADLEHNIQKHELNDKNFSLMFIDVDHFKTVNDNWGHVIGSQMLTMMGDAIKGILRGSDHVYRYGGDEFVVIMPNVKCETVHSIALRVLEAIKEIEFNVGEGKTHKLTVSIGIAEYPTDAKSAKEIIQFADDMMYLSKKSGRGKVFHIKEVDDVDARSK